MSLYLSLVVIRVSSPPWTKYTDNTQQKRNTHTVIFYITLSNKLKDYAHIPKWWKYYHGEKLVTHSCGCT